MKRILKYIAGTIFVLVICLAYTFRSSLYPYFSLSWLTEKCIICHFENRDHCNICKTEHRQCPFCDRNSLNMEKQR